MKNKQFDLKAFREAIGLTQRELAEKVEVSQSTLNGWEQNPRTITIENLSKIAEATNNQVIDLLTNQVAVKSIFKLKDDSINVRDNLVNKVNEFNNFIDSDNNITNLDTLKMQLKILSKSIANENRKLNLALFGKSDAGKSTLTNTLIGEEVSPTQWSAATRAVIKFIHIDDKPLFLGDDDTVVISTPVDESSVSVDRLFDEGFMNKNMCQQGNRSLINEYGIHNNKLTLEEDRIYTIFSFVDSDILKGINIIDTPGTSTGIHAKGISDTTSAENTRSEADLVIYTSPLNQFLHNEDQIYLKAILDYLPDQMDNIIERPLSNLWIVATQAHIDREASETFNDEGKIADKAFENFINTLPLDFVNSKGEEYIDALRSRFFTFTRDYPNLSIKFKNDLLSNISEYIEKKTYSATESFKIGIDEIIKLNKEEIDKLNIKYQDINNVKKILSEKKNERSSTFKKFDEAFKNSIFHTEYYSQKSQNEFRDSYEEMMTIEVITSLIDTKKFKNQKKDKEALFNLINNMISDKANTITKKYSVEFSNLLKKEIEEFDLKFTTFEFKRSLISLLSGGLASGALYYYMGTLGNLGGYILVAQTVGVLSSLGITVGGGAVATSAIAAIGGPVAVVIGAGVLLSMSMFTFTGIGWKKSLAKKVISTYEEENTLSQYLESIKNYWEETADSLEQNKSALKKQYDLEIIELENESDQNPKYFAELANKFELANNSLGQFPIS